MKRFSRFTSMFVMLALLLSAVGCSSSNNQQAAPQQAPAQQASSPVELYVLAAASLTDVMKELTPLYESTHPDQKLVISYGSSGTLQQQIEQGAPADLFISAATKQMKELVEKGLIDAKNTADLVTNRLVLIIPKDSQAQVHAFADLQKPAIEKIAIGQPESVPAGTYAKQSLTNLGIWDALQPKFIFTKDVRQVLTYVETGNVDAGIVYQTDAASSDNVKIAAVADEKTHSPIVYPIGITTNSKHAKEAQTLYSWLQEPEAKAIFTKYGFETAVKNE
ncbi:molybdate ABC transporter substrate-binding protein [Brevibacillus sp. SYP-B805]|nr:molybdate ABC transporter substrate-binding protein [Brevibacillus sp. SYP-B805]NGQ93935.1 molybdate ABC transporter substrate-binding protein [Brevibacillus sp. SYP-B805]